MLRLLVGTGAILLACEPLFTGPPSTPDWMNNVWMIRYGADHIRHTGLPPFVYNTFELGGIPYPVFYGFLVYPLLSGLALVVGASTALRIAIVGVVAMQYAFVRRAVRVGGGDELLATVVACLTVWAIYPFTNAYNRGAMTEFLGTGLLTCALCRWFAFLDADTLWRRLRIALEVGLLYTLAAGTHAITALYGFVFLVLHAVTLFALTQNAGRRSLVSRSLALVPAAVATIIVLAPWVYAYTTVKDKLSIRTYGLHLFPNSIDAWWLRLSPLPLDAWLMSGLVDYPGPTPYLDAQANVPLLFLSATVVWVTVHRLGDCRILWLLVPALFVPKHSLPVIKTLDARTLWLLVPTLLGIVFLIMSLRSRPYEVLPSSFQMVQFPYRLVTYINLAALSGILLAVRLSSGNVQQVGWGISRPGMRTVLLLAVLGLSALGLGFKFSQLDQLYRMYQAGYRPDVAHLPDSFYGWDAYTTSGDHELLEPKPENQGWTGALSRMSVTQERSRQYDPLHVKAEGPTYIITQVQPFPWNKMELDGVEVPNEHLLVWFPRENPPADWNRRPYLVVPVTPGEHVIVYRFRPPGTWLWLTAVSFVTFVIWTGVVMVLQFWQGDPQVA
jgi:hypothetical protein